MCIATEKYLEQILVFFFQNVFTPFILRTGGASIILRTNQKPINDHGVGLCPCWTTHLEQETLCMHRYRIDNEHYV